MQSNVFKNRRLQLAFLASFVFGAAATFDGVSFAQYVPPQPPSAPTQADFDPTLLDIPDGETGEFYRERLSQIQREARRVGVDVWEARRNRLTQKDTIAQTPAPPDSLEGKIFAALLKTEKILIEAPDLPSRARGGHFSAYVELVREGVRDAAKRYALLQELLETEKAREPIILSRVVTLYQTLADFPILDVEPSPDAPSIDAASLEKLLDVPAGESAEFYRERFDALIAARWQVAGLDDARSAALPAPPYPQEPHWSHTPETRRAAAAGRIDAALRKIASFLADAEEISPALRYYCFQRDVNALGGPDVGERLAEIVARETAREATNPIDKRRAPYVRFKLARFQAIRIRSAAAAAFLKANPRLEDDEYWATLPRDEQEAFVRLARGETPYPVPEEQRDELSRLADEIIDLVETGGVSRSAASAFVDERLDPIDAETATRVRRAILESLPENFRTDDQQTLYAELSRKIAQASLIGSVLPLEGRNVDGTPFDWAAYRGAPVLIEIFKANDQGWFDLTHIPFVNGVPDAVARYEAAGLKVVRYGVGDFENTRRHAEALRKDPKLGSRDLRADVVDPNRPIVGPFPGLRPEDDWPARFGLDQWRCWVLVDADGRVLALQLPTWQNDFAGAPSVQKVLKVLYPNVDASTPAPSDATLSPELTPPQPLPNRNLPPSQRPIPNPWTAKPVF